MIWKAYPSSYSYVCLPATLLQTCNLTNKLWNTPRLCSLLHSNLFLCTFSQFSLSSLANDELREAQLLAIVAGLQEGIEDLLAGRIFHPKKEDTLNTRWFEDTVCSISLLYDLWRFWSLQYKSILMSICLHFLVKTGDEDNRFSVGSVPSKT